MKNEKLKYVYLLGFLIQMLLMIAAIIALFFSDHEIFQDLLIFYLITGYIADMVAGFDEKSSEKTRKD